MKFFLTGASGELGSALAKRLVRDGHEVVAYLRHPSDDSALKDLSITIGRGALLDTFGLKKWMKGCDGVFHVAGLISWTRKDRDKLFLANADGVASVVQTAKELKIPRVVVTSSVLGIGLPNHPDPVDETFTYNAAAGEIPYSLSKHKGQEMALALAEPGFDVVCVNPGVIIGPKSRIVSAFRDGRNRPPSRYFPGGMSFVDIDAVVEGHVLAFTHGRSGEKYILGGENLPYQAVFAQVAAAFGKPAPTRCFPPSVLKGIARLSECYGSLCGKGPARIPYSLAKVLCGTHYFSSRKAEQELGWTWKPLHALLSERV